MTDSPDDLDAEQTRRRTSRRRIIGSIIVLAVLTGISILVWMNVHYPLPDGTDPAVKAETRRAEVQIARSLTAADDTITSTTCEARLLGRDDGDRMLHAVCVSNPGIRPTEAGYRVYADGTVDSVAPGPDYEERVRDLFGSRLGNWYLNHIGGFEYLDPTDTITIN